MTCPSRRNRQHRVASDSPCGRDRTDSAVTKRNRTPRMLIAPPDHRPADESEAGIPAPPNCLSTWQVCGYFWQQRPDAVSIRCWFHWNPQRETILFQEKFPVEWGRSAGWDRGSWEPVCYRSRGWNRKTMRRQRSSELAVRCEFVLRFPRVIPARDHLAAMCCPAPEFLRVA